MRANLHVSNVQNPAVAPHVELTPKTLWDCVFITAIWSRPAWSASTRRDLEKLLDGSVCVGERPSFSDVRTAMRRWPLDARFQRIKIAFGGKTDMTKKLSSTVVLSIFLIFGMS